jgi:hypothetical protein
MEALDLIGKRVSGFRELRGTEGIFTHHFLHGRGRDHDLRRAAVQLTSRAGNLLGAFGLDRSGRLDLDGESVELAHHVIDGLERLSHIVEVRQKMVLI